MKIEPLFIRYINKEIDTKGVITSFIDLSEDKKSIEIANKYLEDIPDLSLFRRDFANCVEDVIDNGISRKVINYIDSYLKPSLLEINDNSSYTRMGDKRWVVIKEDNTPWIEALICYNLAIYIKAYGISELKKCPICNKFFSHKGKYAKYCSDICKGAGGNQHKNTLRPDISALI